MKLDLILENIRLNYTASMLEESEVLGLTEKDSLTARMLINESTMTVRKMLVEGGLMQGTKDILEEAWTAALIEEAAKGAAYDAYFKEMLAKCKYDSVEDMPEDAKKAFFEKVDAGWNSASEAGKDGKTK